jgi:hypothetical protein
MKSNRKTLREMVASLLAVFLVLSVLPVSGLAQTETGQITVKASDPQGAVIPAATVSVKSVERAQTVTGTTNDEGVAIITNLQPGLYEIVVSASGFANYTQRAQITAGAKLSIDASLAASGAGVVVDVVAGEGGVEVNTQTQELSNVVSAQQVTELPTLTRNPYALVAISGNVSDADPSGRGTGFAINGQRSASTNILLDGGENVDTFTATVGQSVPLDSVQEFRIITSNFSAEYGRASGGIVNVTTRSGTNDFHGTLFLFNRVDKLASNDFDDNAQGLEKSHFVRNQFGYSVGGRIIRDKLFFFSSTEFIRVRSSANITNWVPTPQFLNAVDARTRSAIGAFGTVAPIGRTLSRAQVSTLLGIGAGAFSNLPAGLPVFGEVQYQVPADVGAGAPQNSYQSVGRIDWNATDKTQVYGRFAIEDQLFFDGSNAFSPFVGFNTGAEALNQNYLINLTRTWSPTLVSQSKLVFNRLNNNQPLNPDQPPTPSFYFRGTTLVRLQGNLVALPGYLPFGPGTAIPFGGPQNFLQLYQDMNWTKGSHQLRFGGQYIHIRDNRTFGAYQNAVANFSNVNNTEAFNNFVTGFIKQFQVAIDPQGATVPGLLVDLPVSFPNFSRSNRYHEWALYFNDSWRVRPTVTLNLGLRYEYYGVQHNAIRSLDSNFYYGPGATLAEQIASGSIQRAEDSPVGGLWEPDKNNFAPRLGIAWDVTGDGKTSLRGGYGMAYERNFGNVTFNVIQNAPAYAVVTVVAGGGTTIPVPTDNFGPLGGSTGSVRLPGTLNARHVDQNIVNAYAHFWSAAFERELFERTVFSAEYSGSAGRKLYSISNPNRIGSDAVYGTGDGLGCVGFGGTCDPTNPLGRLNPLIAPLNTRGNLGRSNYNAMILSIDSSNLRDLGLQFTARYTYSHTKDNLSSTFSESGNNFNLGLLDHFNPDLDYGYADFDVRHRFSTSFNYSIGGNRPVGTGFLNQAFGGWTLTGIFTASTGAPFSIFDCTLAFFEVCPRLAPTGGIPFSTPDDPAPADGAPNTFKLIDLSNQVGGTFANPVLGIAEFGPFPANMTERNAFRGPGFWNVDAGLYKNFRVTEGSTIQIRGEVYNVFNHANMFLQGGTAEVNEAFVSGKRFGRRHVQLAAKFIF